MSLKPKILALALICFAANQNYKDHTYLDNNLRCLAANVYHESRGEPRLGQLAVAQVTKNRSESGDYCAVVFRPHQFSWTLKKSAQYDMASWQIAQQVHSGTHPLENFSAEFYHRKTIKPLWAKKLRKLTQIGNHVFYENKT